MGVTQVLLDTHALLWALMEPERLSDRARTVIEDPGVRLVVSAASAWEMATKWRLGHLPEAGTAVVAFSGHMGTLGATTLPISAEDALEAGMRPEAHRDPFDRMLATQCLRHSLPIVTKDPAFREFPVDIIW